MESATTKKTLNVSRGLTYTYYVAPAKENKPTLLLQHGFPDDAAEWADFISRHLVPNGYGVIAPDLLGYSGTSKPTDPAMYKFKLMVQDLVEILDAESVSKVVSLGHDWGSTMCQRFWNLAPDRVSGLVMVNVGFQPPSDAPFDLDKVLEQTKQLFGYGTFWYWKLFTAPDGPKIMNENVDKAFDVLHTDAATWRATMCEPDGVKNVLLENKQITVQDYATDSMRKTWTERMRRDGFEAPLNWYKATVDGHQNGQIDAKNTTVNVPTLFVAYNDDVVCRKEIIGLGKAMGLLPQLTTVEHDGTHWALIAKPDEFGKTVLNWLETNYSSSKL